MIQALQLILSLSFLVVIHELGHFTFARIFGVRVEKFYMFFDWKFSILKAKKINGKWQFRFFQPTTDEKSDDEWNRYPDNTEWGIGWIPFGGYCAIAGMVDETHDAEQIAKTEPQPWEFRSKNVWQRLCIIIGGILVNFIAALIIFGQLLFVWGEDKLPLKNVSTGLYYAEILQNEGFRQQDKIVSIDGQEPQSIGDIVQWLIIEGKRDVTVQRGQETVQLSMSEDLGTRYLALQNEFDRQERHKAHRDKSYQKARFTLISEYIPFVVDTTLAGDLADAAGIRKGDTIVAVAGVPTPCAVMVNQQIRLHPCEQISLTVGRTDGRVDLPIFIGDRCMIGVAPYSQYHYFETEHTSYTLLQSVPAGIKYGWGVLRMYVTQFRLVFTKEGAQSLGGFGAIGSLFPNQWNWYSFWYMTAFLSIMLAFMNFLPIPALDGGYILFLIFEMITGKKPGDKFLERANMIGMWLLLALLIFANGNDIFKLFF
ncbi:MAG: RIP metalloprotease RseP [Paludibacteraceae bacterium]|nr:RIP metalloprotease RseP [Paludibacteraceae bacterium]